MTHVFNVEFDEGPGDHKHLVYGLVDDVWHERLDADTDTADHQTHAEHNVERKDAEEQVRIYSEISLALLFVCIFCFSLFSPAILNVLAFSTQMKKRFSIPTAAQKKEWIFHGQKHCHELSESSRQNKNEAVSLRTHLHEGFVFKVESVGNVGHVRCFFTVKDFYFQRLIVEDLGNCDDLPNDILAKSFSLAPTELQATRTSHCMQGRKGEDDSNKKKHRN